MDSDDIMLSDRLKKQIYFMDEHPDILVCGSNMKLFKNIPHKVCISETHHPQMVDWNFIKQNIPLWLANHPTLCYRKSAILNIGNYNVYDTTLKFIQEDYDLELQLIKKYGSLVNLQETLILYRLHLY